MATTMETTGLGRKHAACAAALHVPIQWTGANPHAWWRQRQRAGKERGGEGRRVGENGNKRQGREAVTGPATREMPTNKGPVLRNIAATRPLP